MNEWTLEKIIMEYKGLKMGRNENYNNRYCEI